MRQSIRLSSSSTSGAGGSAKVEATTAPGTMEVSNSKGSSDSEFFGNRFSFQSLRKRATGKAIGGGGGGHKRNSSGSSFFSNR